MRWVSNRIRTRPLYRVEFDPLTVPELAPMAIVILASPNTWGQSAKARLVVISSEVFS